MPRIGAVPWVAVALVASACGGGSASLEAMAPSAYQVSAAETEVRVEPEVASGGMGDDAMAGAAAAVGATDDAAPVMAAGMQPPGSPNLVAAVVGSATTPTLPAAAANEAAPLLVYTATIGMEVDEAQMATTIDRIVDAAVAGGGYLAGRSDRSVTVRVPSRAFRQGLAAIEQLGYVTTRSVTADDVSAEFHDLDVRLVNLRALRARYEQLLERAANMEEILRIEAELERLAREIDGMEGRLRFLRSRVAFSVVTVTLSPPPPAVVVAAPPPPPPPAPPPPRRVLPLPIPWLAQLGVEALIDLGGTP